MLRVLKAEITVHDVVQQRCATWMVGDVRTVSVCAAGSNSKEGVSNASLRKRRVGAGDVEMTDVSEQTDAIVS